MAKWGPADYVSGHVMGTLGYAAPEYVATGNLVVYFSSGMPQLGVSKFGSVRFLSKKLTKIKI